MAISKLVSLGRIGFVVEGDFDSTREYKKLSLVKVPSTGSVYVSKEDIPANTDITDERWYKILDAAGDYSDVIEEINNRITNLGISLNNKINNVREELLGAMVWGQSYNNATSDTLLVGVPKNVELIDISGILFKSPRDGYTNISVVAYDDNIPTGVEILNLELDEPLFQGNTYCIAKIISFGIVNYVLTVLSEHKKFVESKAYITTNGSSEPKSLMINAMANVRDMNDNIQYNFNCINPNFDIDLFECAKISDGSRVYPINTLDGGDPETANYRRLIFTHSLRIMFHIGGYYKNINVKGGNYYSGEAGNNGSGSRFSQNYTYPKVYNESIDNDIPLSIPQLFNRDDVSLTQLIIPKNTNFTIILLPNMDAATGNVVKSRYSKCPYSMMIWFDDFESIIEYNSGSNSIDNADPVNEDLESDE